MYPSNIFVLLDEQCCSVLGRLAQMYLLVDKGAYYVCH